MKNKPDPITYRPTTTQERMVLRFLNKLRDSGKCNMFGAAPYIRKAFGIKLVESNRLLELCMENFDESGKYEEVKITA